MSGFYSGEPVLLVADNLPAGKRLFVEAGVSTNPDTLAAFARRLPNCPANFEACKATDVGLRPRTHQAGWTGHYLESLWCVIADEEAKP